MSYLNKLKQQAQVVKSQQQTAKDQKNQKQTQFEQHVQPALDKIQTYLQDLAEQLNVVKPDVRTRFKLGGFGEIDNLLQADYELTSQINMNLLRQKNYAKKQIEATSTTKTEVKPAFLLQFICKAEYPIRICKKTPREVPLQRDYLHKHGFRFKFEEEKTVDGQFKRGVFLLRPDVSTKLIFQGNIQNTNIEMTTVNFNLLGKQHYTINPIDVNENFLDELAKYVVHDSHCLAIHEKTTDLIKPKKMAAPKPTKPVQMNDLKVKLAETSETDNDEFNQWLHQTKQNLEEQATEPKKKSSLFSLLKIGG
ncbi:hypothetical protein [Candidatus Albibeggiatoa sp. nov. BB20]|uniref:hypothetical protein n=1 Tax=Candidatus Albibeggiatoa sp. nov. BB20 TaxID=3162723 RepID=UPI00336562FA